MTKEERWWDEHEQKHGPCGVTYPTEVNRWEDDGGACVPYSEPVYRVSPLLLGLYRLFWVTGFFPKDQA